MDTDDLSEMAHYTLRLAESITHDLTIELGVLSANYRDEDEYSKGMLKLIREVKRYASDFLDENDLQEKIPLKKFRSGLSQIEQHIKSTLNTPMEERKKFAPTFEIICW